MKKTIVVVFVLFVLFPFFSIAFSEPIKVDRVFPKAGTKYVFEVIRGKNRAEFEKGLNKAEITLLVIEDGKCEGKEVHRIKAISSR